MSKDDNKPTVAAVVKYAEELRRRAQRQRELQVYSQPYSPSEAAARKLSQRLGPEGALRELATRAAQAEAEYREQEAIAERASKRHARRMRSAMLEREAQRQGLTPGQRVDAVIARVSVVAAGPSLAIDGDRVRGGERDSAPRWQGDPSGELRGLALDFVRGLELEAERLLRRMVEGEAA